ncbi:MAG: hypothetical protein WBB27_14250 [Maribacter sp.]
MKKIIGVLGLFTVVVFISSCEYDDSNDIDILKPVDSTATGVITGDIPK